MSRLKSGTRPISPANAALFCGLLHLSSEETQRIAAEAVIENAPKHKQKSLRAAFFNSGWQSLDD